MTPPNPWSAPFWLLCTPRSGSTWVARLLNKAVGMPLDLNVAEETIRPFVVGEQFHFGVPDPFPFVAKVHLHQADQCQLWDRLDTLPEIRLIRLTRRKTAEQAASYFCTRERKHAAHTPEDCLRLQHQPIGWDLSWGVHALWDVIRWEQELDNRLRGRSVLRMFYEDWRDNPREQLDRAMGFVGVRRYAFDDQVGIHKLYSPNLIVEQIRALEHHFRAGGMMR